MKRSVVICLLGILSVMAGCHKKEEPAPLPIVTLNAETLSVQEADTILNPVKIEEPGLGLKESVPPGQEDSPKNPPALEDSLAETPMTDSLEPTEKLIQTALKNLGLYVGQIDGVIGPKTKVAIREFQRQNNLNPDGKVGPKTWAVLQKAL